MNERIKEMWDKAAESTTGDSWESQERFMGKFAELIIRECAGLCEGEATFAGMNGRKDASASNCATIIRNHFGVE